MDRRYLNTIALSFGGGPAGNRDDRRLAVRTRDAIEDIIEHF